MDEQRFDEALRAFGQAASRRRAIAGALAALVGAPLAAATAAPRHGDTSHDRSARPGRRPAMSGPCGDGTRTDNACTTDAFCCTGFCDTTLQTRDGKGRCRCLKKGASCTRKQTCCGRLSCIDKVCEASGPTPPPPPPPPTCSGASCAAGCCDGSTCVPYASQSASQCGAFGAACAPCTGSDTCQTGLCMPPSCSAITCAAGCCDGSTCVPYASQGNLKCGTAGNACGFCTAPQTCNAVGTCVF